MNIFLLSRQQLLQYNELTCEFDTWVKCRIHRSTALGYIFILRLTDKTQELLQNHTKMATELSVKFSFENENYFSCHHSSFKLTRNRSLEKCEYSKPSNILTVLPLNYLSCLRNPDHPSQLHNSGCQTSMNILKLYLLVSRIMISLSLSSIKWMLPSHNCFKD